jgi:hypothetical protein
MAQREATDTISAEEAREELGQSMSEDELHKGCVKWADAQAAAVPELEALFHPPNGGARSAAAGARMKEMGARAGIPDICLPIVRPVIWMNGDHVPAGALWIELKSQDGRLRDNQCEWRARLLKHQHCWTLVRSLGGFREAVMAYIRGEWEQAPLSELD